MLDPVCGVIGCGKLDLKTRTAGRYQRPASSSTSGVRR
jgi:hypothetical protein